jgi:glycosyltransferase involved in cell wall biosynthesis
VNVCVVTQQVRKTYSGVGLHTNNLVASLLKDGHQVWVVAPEDQRPPGKIPYAFHGVRAPFFQKNQARWIALSWSFSRALAALLQREPVDLIHFTDAREAFFFHTKLPVIGHINDTYSADLHSLSYYRRYYDDWLVRWGYYHFVHACEKAVFARMRAVIANSRFTAGIVAEQYHVSPERLFTCYKSVDPQKYRPALDLRGRYAGQPQQVLFVGTNMQRKGLPALIQAAPVILEKRAEMQFCVVGEDRAIPNMKRLCQEIGVADHFHFLGWKSQLDLVAIYAQAGVFVMPSITEALGVAFLEAMAAGVPVVGTAVGGIPEIIQDGVNGRLVSPDAPAELAGAVLEILSDEQKAEIYRQAGLRTVAQFNIDRMMDCTYAIYRAVCPPVKLPDMRR